MAIDVDTFKAEFPEFIDAPDGLVTSNLDRGQQLTSTTTWGDSDIREQGVFLYCAKFLALSPYARKMGLVNDKGMTNYDARLEEMMRMVCSGFRVTG